MARKRIYDHRIFLLEWNPRQIEIALIYKRHHENEISTLSTEFVRTTSSKPYHEARPRGINGLPVLPFQLRLSGFDGHVGQERISMSGLLARLVKIECEQLYPAAIRQAQALRQDHRECYLNEPDSLKNATPRRKQRGMIQFKNESALQQWIERCLVFVKSLPPK